MIKNIVKKIITKNRLNYTEPIIIYQMGKVVSKSIHLSLKKFIDKNKYSLFHTHTLNYLYQDPVVQLLYNHIIRLRKPTKFISLVRDPIARNVSSFFEMKNIFFKGRDINTIATKELINVFFDKFHHKYPLIWFDIELLQVTGVDIFEHQFNKENGTLAITQKEFEILILKTELNNNEKELVIKDFLSLNEFKLNNHNVTEEKKVSRQYLSFIDEIKFSEQFLKKIYSSAYMKYFYTQDEINNFYQKWLK